MSQFAIAGLQLELSGKDNRYLIEKAVRQLHTRYPWVQMVVLGELATYGADPATAQALPGEAETFYSALARDTGLWLIPGSVYERDEELVYNTALVFNPQGETVGRYRKLFPFLPYEKGVTAGADFLVFDVPAVGRFGLSICYDQWFPETTRQLAWLGAEVVLCPTMTNTIDRELELCLARANAISNQCYFFNINVAGPLGNGRSIIVGPEGEVIHTAGERDEWMPVNVDLAQVRRVRERGVHGLGQTLKSFRDSHVDLPAYPVDTRASAALADLGPLALPRAQADGER